MVTPSYNQGQFIEDTIQSVLTQDYPHIEYIVMDGGSTDSTLEILRKYEGRLKWISESDRGQSHALNKGFKMAKGTIICWLNSDDLFLPGCISSAVKAFEHNPAAGLVYGEGYNMDADGGNRVSCNVQPLDLWRLIHRRNLITQPSAFFKKEVLEAVGYIKEDLHYTMDWDLWIRIAMRYPAEFVREFWSEAREYPENKVNTGGLRRLWESYLCTRYGIKKIPPGLIAYGLETILRRLNQVRSRLFRRLFSPANRFTTRTFQVLFSIIRG